MPLEPSELSPYIGRLVERCRRVASVWVLREGSALLVFTDRIVLSYLRRSPDLLRPDVELVVVTAEENAVFAGAGLKSAGTFASWKWAETSSGLAHYAEPASGERCVACRVWQPD